MTADQPQAPAGGRTAAPDRAAARERPTEPMTVCTLCRDQDAFAALGPQWDELHRRCRSATAFQTHAWLYSWWLSYGTPGRLRLVLVHQSGRLVGVAPLMLVYRPMPVLVPLGGGITDFCDVLLDDACADAAADALARRLRCLARTAVIDLREVRPGAAVEQVFERWWGPRRKFDDSVCMEFPALPIEELLRRLSKSAASKKRRKLRELDSLGVEPHPVPAAEVPATVATLLRLHALQWQGRKVNSEHLTPRFAEHLKRALTRMAGTGHARVTEFRVGDKVLAADIVLVSASLAGGYLYGAHPDLRARKIDITAMLMRNKTAHATSAGCGVVSMLRGAEPYKNHWRPTVVVNQRLLLARRRLAPALGAAAAWASVRPRLADAVRGGVRARSRPPGGSG